MKRNPARIIEIIIWPMIEVLSFSLLASSLQENRPLTDQTATLILVGVIYWNATARIVQETVSQVIDDFHSKNIQHIMIAPLSSWDMLMATLMASVTKLLISYIGVGAILALTYQRFFSSITISSVLWVLELNAIGVVFSITSLGIVFLVGERASAIGWVTSSVLHIFSLVYYQRSTSPALIKYVSYAVPSSYVFESVRSPGYLLHEQPVILGLTFLYGLVGCYVYIKFIQLAKKRGTLSKQ